MTLSRFSLLLIVLLTLPLAACGLVRQGRTPADPTATARTVAPKKTPAPATGGGRGPAAAATATAPSQDAPRTAGGVAVPADIAAINSYTFFSRIVMAGEAFAIPSDTIVKARVVKDQAAYQLVMTVAGLETTIIQIGDTTYTQADVGVDIWVRGPASESLYALQDYEYVAGEDYLDDLGQMENLGVEEINGRRATHYRADREALAAINDPAIDFDFSQADEAQLDIWIDLEFNFPIKSVFIGEGVGMNTTDRSRSGRMELYSEFGEINGDFTIEAPTDNVVDE